MYPDVRFLGFDLYSILFTVGIVVGFSIFYLYARKKKVPKDIFTFYLSLSVISVSAAFLTAILFQSFYNFIETGFFKLTGITFLGGLFGGVLTFLICYWRFAKPTEREHFKTILNIAPPAITLGHFFGRIGCFMVGSCHGKITSSVFGMTFKTAELIYGVGAKVHPTQLYEAAFLLVIFTVTSYLFFKDREINLAVYLIGYGIFRFSIEFLRGDNRGEFIPGLSPSQALSIILVVAGIVYLIPRAKLSIAREG